MNTLHRALAALITLSIFAAARAQDPVPSPFLRFPDIHGDRVVFTSEGDLWLGHIPTGAARRITSHPGEEYAAHFSPDGQSLAFTGQYDGGTDVYVMRTEGGSPKRLTWDPSVARVVGWTPDGKSVLFRSRRDNPERRYRLWTVPATGGMPEMLPIPRVDAAAMHSDGRRVAYVPVSIVGQNWKRYEGGRADTIWLADIRTNSHRKITRDPRVDAMPVWVGDDLYTVSERNGPMNLHRLDPASGRSEAVTRYTDFDVRYPASDGKRIVFQHGHGLALYDPSSRSARPLSFALNSERIHTRERRVPARNHFESAHIGPTGKRVLVEARGQILSLPAEEGAVRSLVTGSDHRARRPAWSPDGARIAFLWDKSGEEQVWVMPSDGSGEPRMLTRDRKGPLNNIRWSPDGRRITTSDRENRILLVDTETGETTLVDQSDRGGTYATQNNSARFSPDGKWLAFDREEPNEYRAVYLYEIATGAKTRVTHPETQSYAPAWDIGGKYLYFISDRQFNPRTGSPNHAVWFADTARVYLLTLAADTPSPFLIGDDAEGPAPEPAKPAPEKKEEEKAPEEPKDPKAPKLPEVRVDLDGIADRIVTLPAPAGRYRQLESVANRLLMLAVADGGSQVRAFNTRDPRKKEIVTIARATDLQVSANGKKLLLQSGSEMYVVDAATSPISTLSAGRVDWSGASVTVDPPAEWRQIYHEGWRVVRDFFYDPGMSGVHWDAIREKYAAMLPNVADRSELNLVLGDMMGELATGHAYVSGGDTPGAAPRTPMGYLGADLEPVDGAVRVARILPGDGLDVEDRSPLLEPGVNVKPGDYIVAVNGRPVRADEDFQSLMVGTAGTVTALLVNDRPERDGAREVRIRPLASEDGLRTDDWVRTRAARVEQRSGGRIGYIHLPNMGDDGLREFAKQYYPKVGMDALIFDVRNNGGGWVAPHLLQHVAAKNLTWRKPRYGSSWTRTPWAFDGHAATVTNEYTSSNGEDWADLFQRLELGPVIGARTWGGLVGSGGGWNFMDGGRINPPNYGAWAPKAGWIVEGPGAIPDILVEQDPAAVLAGDDPQLDRAIDYLLDRLARHPVERPTHPPFPVR